jgi:Rrf2 family protein
MSISAKTEYACLAVLDLAVACTSAEPVRVRSIAESHGIPARFLVQILLQLKGAGVVTSTRGAAGGYRLARDPAHLSVWEVMCVIEGCESPIKSNAGVPTIASETLLQTWQRAASQQREVLEATTFADLAEAIRDEAANMYYI